MQNILEKSPEELKREFAVLSLPAFRAAQVYAWLHKHLVFDFNEMTNLSKELRATLAANFSLQLPTVKKVFTSRDGTKKYLFLLHDGNLIESVLLKDETGRKTICLSSQASCPLGCSFCATASVKFKRNLSVAEIIGQVYRIAEKNPDVANLVFMGMGEPLLNYEHVIKAIRLLTAKEGPNFGQRKIVISTCGLPEQIRKLAEEALQVRLAISLNAALDSVRSRLMPINRKHPLAELRDALIFYIKLTGRRVTLEYVMLNGINDRQEDLRALRNFCAELSVNVNLIPFNPFGKDFSPSPLKTIHHFLNGLMAGKINATARRSRGVDILAACGQLAGRG